MMIIQFEDLCHIRLHSHIVSLVAATRAVDNLSISIMHIVTESATFIMQRNVLFRQDPLCNIWYE